MRSIIALCCLLPSTVFADDNWLYRPLVDACFDGTDNTTDAENCIGDAANLCMDEEDGGYSTAGMANCVLAERDAWDTLLNATYSDARNAAQNRDASYRETDPHFANSAESLLTAQRAWIVFRDANCRMKHDVWGNGTMRITASASCKMHMTAERTLELRDYIDLEN